MTTKEFEFFVLRFVPDPVKEEFVNVAVCLIQSSSDQVFYASLAVTSDWPRVRCLAKDVDTESLQQWLHGLQSDLSDPSRRDEVIRLMTSELSAVVGVSAVRKSLLGDKEPEMELRRLAATFLSNRE
jgi:hypothetical protein